MKRPDCFGTYKMNVKKCLACDLGKSCYEQREKGKEEERNVDYVF
jgi:hypothetical protein